MTGRILAIALLGLATFVIAAGNDISDSPLWLALLSWLVFLGIAITAAALFTASPLRRIIAALAAVYGVACLALAVFQIASPMGLDADFILARPVDSAKTLVRMIGWPVTVIGGIVVFGVAAAFAIAVNSLAAIPRHPRTSAVLLIALLGGTAFVGVPHPHLRTPVSARGGIDIQPAVAPPLRAPLTRNESVFILQLESVNGLITSEGYTVNGKPVGVDPLTSMRQLAQKGIFFPHVWSQGVQTHRAQEAILCGAVRNVHLPSFDRLMSWDGDCLPALLRKAGYRTVFLKSVEDRGFGGAEEFMQRAGFEDIHFADFMKPGDPLTRWGYEEGAFYTRAFEYLRSRYRPDEKLFVLFAVSAHHFGFTRRADTDMNFLLSEQDQRVGLYLWSQKIQDQSLLTFDRLVRDFAGDRAHVLYMPDHSIPLGLYGSRAPSAGATIDNFVTPLLYVPPAHRASELALGRTVDDVMHAHADLMPTFVELLSDQPQPNSLVPFMRRNPPARHEYEQCHVMSQPFDGKRVLIARGDHTYEYHVARQTLREFRIRRNPMRQELVSTTPGVTWQEFDRRYGCRRYQAGT